MKLNDNEKEFIKEMANIMKDADIAHELTRIRMDFDISKGVSIRQVQEARYRMGITKVKGRGRGYIKREDKND